MMIVTFSFVSGVLFLQQMARLPEPGWAIPTLLAALIVFPYRKCRPVGWFLLGWVWAMLAANLAMQDSLDPAFEGKDLLVEGRLCGIPQSSDHSVRFGFNIDAVDDAPDGSLPRKIRLSWHSPPVELKAGERWRLRVRLKQPHGSLNPGGFDYEQWLYLQGYRATGYVKQNSAALRLEEPALSGGIDRIRQSIAERLAEILEASRVSGIIQALVVGEQHDITSEQWEVFRKTGTTHLVAISGLHISLLAGLAFLITRWLWVRIGSLRFPAPSVAAGSASLCAILYSALAGLSLPTQRSMIMISLVMGAIVLRRKVIPSHILALALILIVLYDPTSVLSPGLWLSFCAVALIAYTMSGRIGRSGGWSEMRKIQLVTAAGLAPLLLLYFQQVSLIAPLANLVAVPVVSLLVVPACLLGSILLLILPKAGIMLLAAAGYLLEMLWRILEWLSELPFAQWSGSQPSFVNLILATAGLLLAFAPRGIPARWLGAPMLLPMIFANVDPPDAGEFHFTLLDVDQGLAAVAETANHTLVFDTGARFSDRFDMGSAVVAPFLRSRNIQSVNRLVISHADNDHIGGARSLNKLIHIEQIYTSARESIDWRRVDEECKAGQNWTWDGVEFRMLAPLTRHSGRENDNSCVLRIQSRSHSILLTGDIEQAAESALVANYGARLASDTLVVSHHGSNTSSTPGFLDAVGPKYALIPAGYRNRYGFPRPQVIARLERVGAELYNTANSGAILISPYPKNPTANPIRYRTIASKYYNFQPPAPDSDP